MTICVTGQPLSGKTTIAKRMAKQLECPYFSSGAYARSLGMKYDEADVQRYGISTRFNARINRTIVDRIERNKDLVLDGYPRSVEQAMILRNIKRFVLKNSFLVLFFMVNPMVLEQRMKKRGRGDDVREIVIKRAQIMLSLYEKLWDVLGPRVRVIDGSYEEEGIMEEVNLCLELYLGKSVSGH